MPVGVIINVLSVFLGGIAGTVLKDRIKDDFKETMNMIFGIASMGMGITSVILMQNMPAVIFSLVAGTAAGIALGIGKHINGLVGKMTGGNASPELLTVIVLFCASGTGIYGALVEGMSGDPSILIAKSILDFFTAMIFACSLGKTVSFIAVPQCVIMLALFFLAGVILPHATDAMINDFKACGGLIMIATAFRILKLKMIPTADMLPAMILVMPLSWLWVTAILPLL